MVQSSEHGGGGDRTGERGSDVLGGNRNALPDPLVRPSRIEVAPCVFAKDVPKMRLGQDDDVIEALAPDAPEKSLAHGVHERRPPRGAQDASTGAIGNAVEPRSELVVP